MSRTVLTIEEVTVFNTYLFPVMWIVAGVACACWIAYKRGERAPLRSTEAWYDSIAMCLALLGAFGGFCGLAVLCGRYETAARGEMEFRSKEFDRDIERARMVARSQLIAEPVEAEPAAGRLSPVPIK